MHSPGNSVTGFVLFLVLQIIFVIVFAALGRYGKDLLPASDAVGKSGGENGPTIQEVTHSKYPRK